MSGPPSGERRPGVPDEQPTGEELLPQGAYLMSEYHDGHRGVDIRTVYYEDGRVVLTDAEGTLALCTFTPEQVMQAKAAIGESGLFAAGDQPAGDVHDATAFSYAWSLDGQRG